MGVFDGMRISASGLSVERKRLEVISENIANINSPASKDGQMFQPRKLITSPARGSFNDYLSGFREFPDKGVEVEGIYAENKPARLVYEPSHPLADEKGFVSYPDINILDEMIDASAAGRAYQANLTTFNESRKMFTQALGIGKQS